MNPEYTPSKKVLENYAKILVTFALGGGTGIKEGDVVQVAVPDIATPLALELQNAVLKAGGHPLVKIIPSNFDRDFYTYAASARTSSGAEHSGKQHPATPENRF